MTGLSLAVSAAAVIWPVTATLPEPDAVSHDMLLGCCLCCTLVTEFCLLEPSSMPLCLLDLRCICRYELHHGVRINDTALVEAAIMSDRYIADRFLPDKAIDLIDEAAAKLKMEITSKPLHLDEIDRKVCIHALSVMTHAQHNAVWTYRMSPGASGL